MAMCWQVMWKYIKSNILATVWVGSVPSSKKLKKCKIIYKSDKDTKY